MASGNMTASASANSKRVVWVGRMTGPKGDLAKHIAFNIAPDFPAHQFVMVGGPSIPADWPAAPDNVTFTGQLSDLAEVYQSADLVIGAGRVALEAMQLGKPVMAVGESCYAGLVTADTISQAKATNFGDCFKPVHIDWPQLTADLSGFLAAELIIDTSAYGQYLSDYSIDYVNQRVKNSYRQAVVDATLGRHKEVPVLMYHQVPAAAPTDSVHNIYVTQERLREHLTSLKKRGYQAVTFKELAAGRFVKKPVVLTFDDGYLNNYENLLPLLEEFDYSAVIFVLADDQIKTNIWDAPSGEPQVPLMTPEQMKACHDSGRIEIASHGMQHRHLPELSDAELAFEINESKQRLEALLGDEVVSFCYPYGDYAEREAEAVAAAGYLFGIATVSGPLSIVDDFYRIRRINMMPRDKGWGFWKKTSGFYLRYCKMKGKDFAADGYGA